MPKTTPNQQQQSTQRPIQRITQQGKAQVAINIISNNINGLQVSTCHNRLETIIQNMEQLKTDIILIQELNSNIFHYITKKIITELQRKYPRVKCFWSHLRINNQMIYQPGGTGILVKYPLTQHISNVIRDPLGRWTGITIRQKKKKQLSILSVYQPPQETTIKGTISVQAQQTR